MTENGVPTLDLGFLENTVWLMAYKIIAIGK